MEEEEEECKKPPLKIHPAPDVDNISTPVQTWRSLKQTQQDLFLQHQEMETWTEEFGKERVREEEMQKEHELEVAFETLQENEGDTALFPVLDIPMAMAAVHDDEEFLEQILDELLGRKQELMCKLYKAASEGTDSRASSLSFLEGCINIKVLLANFGLNAMKLGRKELYSCRLSVYLTS